MNKVLKASLFLPLSILIIGLDSCSNGSSAPTGSTLINSVWVSGSNIVNESGQYGILGNASSNNIPGARNSSISWIDSNNNLWLFGGYGYDSTATLGDLNDLWKYSPTNNTWTWVSGESTVKESGSYGTSGSFMPGARDSAISWIDASGNLWLFGGHGYDSTGTLGDLNDLWKYSPTNNTWTWVSGESTVNESGSYGTSGSFMPGARASAISWIDTSGNLWLFGGYGYAAKGNSDNSGYLNDLWKYSPTSNTWTWVSGESTVNESGNYNTPESLVPGARASAISWIDTSGNLWLFGGYGYAAKGNSDNLGYLNDLWKYSPTNNTWTWVSGESTVNESGSYGTLGNASSTNIPGARASAISWMGKEGDLVLFGGDGYDIYGNKGHLNDLWKYSPTNNTWTWVNGSDIINQAGVYGSLGIASSNNIPGSRDSSISWIDSNNNLWLFGGHGYDVNGMHGNLNDLWEFIR